MRNDGSTEALQEWEERLIEWCFKFPENNVCAVYFNAMMNRDFRRKLHGGYVGG